MFLISASAAGPDVLPVGDLGILTAVQRAYRLRKRPTPERLRKIGEAWRHTARSLRVLWRSLDNAPVVKASAAKT